MTKYVATPIGSGFNSQSNLNQNFEDIEDNFQRVFYRDGSSPNQMEANIDMNSNTIYNAASVSAASMTINGQLVVANETFVTGIPDPVGQGGKFVRSDGAAASWQFITGDDVTVTVDGVDVTVQEQLDEWTRTDTGAVSRSIQDKLRDYIDIRDFGATLDGVTDDTTALQNALNAGGLIVVSGGTLSVDSATASVAGTYLKVLPDASIVARTPAVVNTSVITVSANYVTIECHGTFNGNSTSRTLVTSTGNFSVIRLYDATGVTADAGSTTSTSGIDIQGNDCTAFINGRSFTNTGQPNGSVPRLITVQGTATRYHIEGVLGNSVRAGLTVGSSTGTGRCETVDITGALDNGIYLLGGDLTVGDVVYRGSEEAVVVKGNFSAESITTVGDGSTALSLDDATVCNVGRIHIRESGGATVANAFRLRSSNVESGTLWIGSITGTIRGDNLCSLSTGTIEKVTIDNFKVKYIYDPLESGTLSSWCSWAGVKEFSISDWDIKVIDTTSALTSSDRFVFTAPTTNLTRLSFAKNIDVSIWKDNETTLSSAIFRGSNFAAQLIYVWGSAWDTTGPYMREITIFNGMRDCVGATPTTGYWHAGRFYADPNNTGTGSIIFSRYVEASGTPGTWRTISATYA